MMTAEQQARDMLERIGIENAQNFSAGDLVELANLIAERDRLAGVVAFIGTSGSGGELFLVKSHAQLIERYPKDSTDYRTSDSSNPSSQ